MAARGKSGSHMRFIWGIVKILSIVGIASATVFAAAITAIGYLSVPPDYESIEIAGFDANADAYFDENGIPTIRAETMRDAYRALGYLHARDRLWQMEAMRRIGTGRLAEIAGTFAVDVDRLMRELRLAAQASAQIERLPPDIVADFQSYADGVNAFISNRTRPLPLEFQLLWFEPEQWTIRDSLIWGRLMSVQLSGDAFRESSRQDLLARLGGDMLRDFLPSHMEGPVTLDEGNFSAWTHPYDASNAWVLDGSRTDTGHPILANDPHLGLGMPGQWYLARIETPELTLVGATAPGVPLHVLGHNGRVAWGMTTTHADNQDTVTLSSNQVERLESEEETIAVRFSDNIEIEIGFNEHGTVISRFGDRPTLLQWSGADTDQDTPQALYLLNRAAGWHQFNAALNAFSDPVQNIFYADIEGRIGLRVAGRLPVRADDMMGDRPHAQRDDEGYWIGRVRSNELPAAVDPENGYFMNANNRIIDDTYPYRISNEFEEGYRATRLVELLETTGERHTVADSMAIQNDILSDAARNLVPLMLDADTTSETGRSAMRLLSEWDYRMADDQPAPLIYATYLNELVRVLAEDDIGTDAIETFWRVRPAFVMAALTDRTIWCDDRRTGPVEPCRWALNTAFERAILRLSEAHGPDPTDWRWGAEHTAPMAHPILGRIPIMSWLSDRPVETPGGDHTLNRGQAPGGAGKAPFRHLHGASLRAIYDLADLDNSRFALAGGQSGNPFSRFYGSLIEDWRDGRYFRIPGRGDDIASESAGVVRFLPTSGGASR